jgi:hypothetical protein
MTRYLLDTDTLSRHAARLAGCELADTVGMEPATLSEVSLPLVAEEELRRVDDTWV